MSKMRSYFGSITLWVFVVFFACMLPSAVFEPSEFDKRGIVTTVGVDKTDTGQVEASVLIVVPQTGGSQSQNLKLYSAIGDNLSQAMLRISLNLGKSLGFAHCEALVMNTALLEDNVSTYLDYFMRSNNVTANITLVASNDKAKEILQSLSSSENSSESSIRDLISYNNKYLYTTDMTLETYYMYLLSGNGTCFFPLIELNEEGQSAQSQSSGSGETESSGSESSGSGGESSGSSGSSSSEKPKRISSTGGAVIVKDGKSVRELSKDEEYGYNLISRITTQGTVTIEDVTDDVMKDATLIFEIQKKYVFYFVRFVDDKPVFNFNINLIMTLDEMMMDEYKVEDISDISSYMSDTVKEKINARVKYLASAVINGMKESRVDTLKVSEQFNAFCHKEWTEYLSKLEDPSDYLNDIIFTIDISLKSKI